jgi:hypothetical protein
MQRKRITLPAFTFKTAWIHKRIMLPPLLGMLALIGLALLKYEFDSIEMSRLRSGTVDPREMRRECAQWLNKQCGSERGSVNCTKCITNFAAATGKDNFVRNCPKDNVFTYSERVRAHCSPEQFRKREENKSLHKSHVVQANRKGFLNRYVLAKQIISIRRGQLKFCALFSLYLGNAWPAYIHLYNLGILANPHIDFYLVGPSLPHGVCTSTNCHHICASSNCGSQYRQNGPCARARSKLKTECHKSGYAATDLKPLLGFLYSEITNRYEWWGWADVDLLLGQLTQLSADKLRDFELVNPLRSAGHRSCGPFMLLRQEYATLFKLGYWKQVVQEWKYSVFDEWWGGLHEEGGDFPSQIEWLEKEVQPMPTQRLQLYDNRNYDTRQRTLSPDGYDGWAPRIEDYVQWEGGMTALHPSSEVKIDIFHFIDLKSKPGWSSSVAKIFPPADGSVPPLFSITCLKFDLSAAALARAQVLQLCGGH